MTGSLGNDATYFVKGTGGGTASGSYADGGSGFGIDVTTLYSADSLVGGAGGDYIAIASMTIGSISASDGGPIVASYT